jgi:hypothetical protein
MNETFEFHSKHEFIEKLKELISAGILPENIEVITPFYVHELEELLGEKPSNVRAFTLTGAVTGLLTGFAFTSFTVLHWKLIVGGKPLVSIPAFVIIAFELTILFGALSTMLGFLIISALPNLKRIVAPVEHNNKFIIILKNRGR